MLPDILSNAFCQNHAISDQQGSPTMPHRQACMPFVVCHDQQLIESALSQGADPFLSVWQDPCVGSAALPFHLWRHILKHLNTPARLRARLVCKDFACLGPHDKIVVAAEGSFTKDLSRMRFAAMLLSAAEQGPSVEYREMHGDCHGIDDHIQLARAPIYSFLHYTNLQTLHLLKYLHVPEAELILELAPAGLQSLGISTEMDIVESNQWTRLRVLSNLQLSIVEEAHCVSPTGLAQLVALRALSIVQMHRDLSVPPQPRLTASGVVLSRLESLSLNWDPFCPPHEPAMLPALKEVHLVGGWYHFPRWMSCHRIRTLGCEDWNAAAQAPTLDPNAVSSCEVLCAPLRTKSASDLVTTCVHQVSIAWLLKLPRLKLFHACKPGTDVNLNHVLLEPIMLEGTRQEYSQMQQKIRFQLDHLVDVQVNVDADEWGVQRSTFTSIQENGHPVLCQCTSCLL